MAPRVTPSSPNITSPAAPAAAGLLDPKTSNIYFFDELFDASDEKISIGRGYTCPIRLDHNRVSRLHGMLSRDEDGQTRWEPISSTNGTFVDGKRVLKLFPIPLRVGMKIRLGTKAMLHAVDADGRADVTASTVVGYHSNAAGVYGSNALAARKIGVSKESVRIKRLLATKDEEDDS